jgi:hypothetical protein
MFFFKRLRLMSTQNQTKDELPDIQENKLPTWAVVIRLVIETIDRLIWLVVLGIIAAIIGTLIVSQQPKVPVSENVYEPVINPVHWEQIDQAITSDLIAAHNEVEQYASAKLDAWISELMVKVDNNFIPWYFGYWNQQALGVQSLFQTAYRWINGNAPTAEEKLNQVIETEFTNRVMQPQTAQLQIQLLTDESVNLYIKNIQNRLDITQKNFQVPQERWQQHLQDIALITRHTEGNRGVSLAFKSVGSTSVAGGIVAERALVKTGAKTLTKTVGKTVGKFTGKTVAKVIGKAGSAAGEAVGEAVAIATAPIVGPVLGVVIIGWDLIDHYQTRKVNEPILRRDIEDYLKKMEMVILNDNSTGIMSAIHDLELQVSKSLASPVKG